MKDLIGKTEYFIGSYMMPVIGVIFNMLTLTLFYTYTYFFFFHFNSLCVYHRLLNMEKRDFDIQSVSDLATEYKICNSDYSLWLWHDNCSISVFKDEDCIVSGYTSANWDKKLNNNIYNLFK